MGSRSPWTGRRASWPTSRTGSTPGAGPAVDSQRSTHGNQQRACTSCGRSTVNTWKSTKGMYQLWTVNSLNTWKSTKGAYQLLTINSQKNGNQQRTCTSCGESTVNTWKSAKDVYQLWTVNSQHMEINN